MQHNTIVLGITPTTQLIFNEEFPHLKKINIEPYNIRYSGWLPVPLKLLMDVPRILKVINKEHQQLEDIIISNAINVVISDNRFGLWNKQVECIYITHQLNMQAGWLSGISNKIHHHYMKKFQQLWVPDVVAKKNIAGKLSQSQALQNVTYIGALSRLVKLETTTKTIDYLILLSGPEPQRTLLEVALMKIANTSTKTICLVRGSDFLVPERKNNNMQIINYARASELSELVSSANCIICRSGYSTLMDLYVLKKQNIILIPTPQQNEQEYLASYWEQNYGAKVVLQKNINKLTLN